MSSRVSASAANSWPLPCRPLQRRQQSRHPIEVLVGVAIVPHPEREQRQDVGEVVVEQDRQRDGIGRLVAALVDQVVKDVDRNRVVVDPIGDAVPVVEHVKAERARLAVVALHEALEVERHAARGPARWRASRRAAGAAPVRSRRPTPHRPPRRGATVRRARRGRERKRPGDLKKVWKTPTSDRACAP